ncbi:MAG: PAS domain S-box protein [Anaerolineaceae bacterium]
MALLEMIQNLAIITSLAMVYRVIMARLERNTITIQVLIGLLFGGFTIIGMVTPFTMMPGVFYDGRSIILSLAGLFCGPLTTIVAAAIAAAYRISLGGGGVIAGVGTIIEASSFGLIFFYLRRSKKIQVNYQSLLAMGVLVHAAMLLFQLTIPNGVGWRVWQEIGLYVMVFFTSVTLVIGLLFLDSENQLLDRKALINSEKTLKKAQHQAQVGSWDWNLKDNRLECSEELFCILGLKKENYSGSLAEVLINYIHPDDVEEVKKAWKYWLKNESAYHIEFRLLRDNGTSRSVWVETGEIIQDIKGRMIGANGILQDITDRRTIERELLENEARYRSLIMNSPDAIFVNHQDKIVLVNNKAVELFGARYASEILGKPVLDFFHPDYHEDISDRIKRLRETGESLSIVQEQIVRLDGRVVDVDVASAPFRFHGGDDIHVILRDITERRQMEKDLRSSRDLLVRLADQVPGVVFQLRLLPDGQMDFPFMSSGIRKIHGLTPEDLLISADPALNRVHPEDKERAFEEFFRSSRLLSELNVEFRISVPDQDYLWYQCSAKPERLDDGGTLWSGILSDITDRKLAEQKIAEQLDELHRWQSVMLGREKRTIDLKQEVNSLLVEMGQPPRYGVVASQPEGSSSLENPPGGLERTPAQGKNKEAPPS